MRYSTAILGAAALYVSDVTAFPTAAIEFAARAEHDAWTKATIEDRVAKYEAHRRQIVSPGFDATAQYVSNQGQYAFVAPDFSTDVRGPCPGLNAMANHGYIPHNGVATIQEFIDGTYESTYSS
jgi:hypothetical protein